ncbi:MAG: aldo/keto reductase, partial [Terriglobales bacterium]
TSTDSTDDSLALIAAEYGLSVVRGSLEDPLSRFTAATTDLDDADLVVRLTGDNTFPDSDLIGELVEEITRSGGSYLRTSTDSGLPYGVSAEIFTVNVLRQADEHAHSPAEREHVTLWIREKFGDATPKTLAATYHWSHLRATVDSFADYDRITRVFAQVEDPVSVSWSSLCELLAQLPDAPVGRFPRTVSGGITQSRLILGTAALDGGYGVANAALDGAAARDVIATAVAHGVTHFDTARAYGGAEQHIGHFLDEGHRPQVYVVTKLRPLDELPEDARPSEAIAATDASVFRSMAALGGRKVETLLLHRARDAYRVGGAVWEHLLQLRGAGYITRLGVSVVSPSEALRALELPGMAYIQLPFNLLDRRWGRVAERLLDRADVTAVARSVFLQGLLTGNIPLERWPVNAGVDPETVTDTLRGLAHDLGRRDQIDLCLAYVRAQSWLDALVIGAVSAEQVRDLCRRFEAPALINSEIGQVDARLPEVTEQLLDPSTWRLSR